MTRPYHAQKLLNRSVGTGIKPYKKFNFLDVKNGIKSIKEGSTVAYRSFGSVFDVPYSVAFALNENHEFGTRIISPKYREVFMSEKFAHYADGFVLDILQNRRSHDQARVHNNSSSAILMKLFFDVHCGLEYKICKELLDVKGKSVLEIGCSTGNLSNMLADDANKVVGIDGFGALVNFAKSEYGSKRDNLEFLATRYPTKLEERFDVCVSFSSPIEIRERVAGTILLGNEQCTDTLLNGQTREYMRYLRKNRQEREERRKWLKENLEHSCRQYAFDELLYYNVELFPPSR